ncbi:MAG: glutathione S-transferase family protein [Pseudomonadota bacterium]
MSDFTIFGFDASTYVRSARMMCEEKGVSYDLQPVDLGSPDHLKLHPFGKIPSVRHGDFSLYETIAIGRYVDRVFDGPALQPHDPKAAARMDQWLSATEDYLYDVLIRQIVWQRLVVPSRGGAADEAMIAAAVPNMVRHLDILEANLDGRSYLAGEDVSLADLVLLPIMSYLRMTPEGGPEIAKRANVSAWYDRMAERPSYAATLPNREEAA